MSATPDTIRSETHKFTLCSDGGESIDFYLVIGFDNNEKICLLQVHNNREDCAMYSLHMDMATSAMAYGMPIEEVCHELKTHEFAPDGLTNNPHIPFAKSVPDYIGNYIEKKYLKLPAIKIICKEKYCDKIGPWSAADEDGKMIDQPLVVIRQKLKELLREKKNVQGSLQ